MSKEIRVSEELKVNLREASSEKRYIEGYASVSNAPTVIWYFEEVIAKGAFTRVLEELEAGLQDVRSLFNHDANYVLGRTARPGFPATLILREDSKGLWTETEAPALGENPNADTVLSNIKRGAVTGMSFAFTVKKQEWEFFDSPDGTTMDRRTITEIGDLYDIGPVTYPAYEQTSVGVRAKAAAKKDHDEARSRWQQRQNSKIVVPKEYAHSLFEMRMSEDTWVEEQKPIDEVIKNEEVQEKVIISNEESAEISNAEKGEEGAEVAASEEQPAIEPPSEEPSNGVDESIDEASIESEARSRQIQIKRAISTASARTRAILR